MCKARLRFQRLPARSTDIEGFFTAGQSNLTPSKGTAVVANTSRTMRNGVTIMLFKK